MKVALIGKPGSGKSTLGRGLAKSLDVPYVSSGDALRRRASEPSAEGREIAARLKTGRMMPQGLVDRLISTRLARPDAARGWILDGYPRRLSEVRTLNSLSVSPHVVLHLRLEDREAMNRITTRGEGDRRSDDADTTARRRIEDFRINTAPVLEAYADFVVEIDATASADQVLAFALAQLRRRPPLASMR